MKTCEISASINRQQEKVHGNKGKETVQTLLSSSIPWIHNEEHFVIEDLFSDAYYKVGCDSSNQKA